MNQTRRDLLKALCLAPFAPLLPAAQRTAVANATTLPKELWLSNLTSGTLYISLHTSKPPFKGDEVSYRGYERVELKRGGSWTQNVGGHTFAVSVREEARNENH